MRTFVFLMAVLLSFSTCAAEGAGVRCLIVGGGSSHDFMKWFNTADVATLSQDGKNTVSYTQKPDEIRDKLKDLDVLYLSANQKLPDPELRKSILEFADAGKGVILAHAATWSNWRDWPEFYKNMVGGSARGHDRFGEFEVIVEKSDHPVMQGVSKSFKITDELYNFNVDPAATPIEVLASAKSPLSGKVFPIVFVVKHPKARVLVITLGHDGKAHDLPEFKAILLNALKWTSGK